MFKRALSLLALISVFNLSLSFQLKQRVPGDSMLESVYHHTGKHFYFIWNFLDDRAANTVPVSQTAIVKYVPVHVTNLPIPVLHMLEVLFAALFTLVLFFPEKRKSLRIKLLPEHANYLFRLKPF